MSEKLRKRALRVVGAKQVLRVLRENAAECVFLAMDASPALRGPIEAAAREQGVAVEFIASMQELGERCRVEVPSAATASLKATDGGVSP